MVIGGFGSLWGTLLGGLILGVAQTMGSLINPQYTNLAGHLVFLAVIAFRSGGILAGREAQRMSEPNGEPAVSRLRKPPG